MSVYMVFSFDVTDRERFGPYGKTVTPIIEKHSGEVVVADFAAKHVEGDARQANAILRFPSEDQANAFYSDPDYAAPKKLREETTTNTVIYLAKQWARPHE